MSLNPNTNNINIYRSKSKSDNSTFHQNNIDDALQSQNQTISHQAPIDSSIHAVLNFAAAEELAVELGLPITTQEEYMYIDPQLMNRIDNDDPILAAQLDQALVTRFTGRLGNGALHKRRNLSPAWFLGASGRLSASIRQLEIRICE